jgi:tetratricopeptide (TPR) repeat protein
MAAGEVAASLAAHERALAPPAERVADRAMIMQNKASSLAVVQDYAAALPLFVDALGQLRLCERRGELPAGSIRHAVCLSNIGQVYAGLLDHRSAARYQHEALRLMRARFGRSERTAAQLLKVAETVLSDSGDLGRAEELVREGLDIVREAAPGSPVAGLYLANLSAIALRRGDHATALRLALDGLPGGRACRGCRGCRE